MQTWWREGWQRCSSKAADSRYCVGHAWALTFPPFWDGGSFMGGSLLHRTTPLAASNDGGSK